MATDNIMKGTERVPAARGGELRNTGRGNYKMATIESPQAKSKPNWTGLVESAAKLYGSYREMADERGKQRSEQILAELTTDERRQAIQDGRLLYQDDKYAMKHMKIAVGRQAAMEKDIETQRMIQQGTKGLRTKEEIDQYLAEEYHRAKTIVASDLNVSEDDPDLLEGWNDNYQRRSIALRETFDQVESKRYVDKAVLSSTAEAVSMFKDPTVLAEPELAGTVIQYMQNKYAQGTIPTPEAYATILKQSLQGVAASPRSTQTLLYLADEPVEIHGAQVTLRQFMGEAEYDNLIMESENSTLAKDNATRSEIGGYEAGIQAHITLGNFDEADRQVDALDTRNAMMQGSDLSSANKDRIISLRSAITQARAQAQAAKRTALDKEAAIQYGVEHWRKLYAAHAAGAQISLDPAAQDMQYASESNKAFFAESAKRADDMLARGSITPELHATIQMTIAAQSHEGSPARKSLTDNVLLAQNRFAGLAALDDDKIKDEDFELYDRLGLMFNANPLEFASIAPEMAGQLQAIAAVNSLGLNGNRVVLDAYRADKNMDEAQRQLKRQEWLDKTLSSEFRMLAQVDKGLMDAGYTIYQALTANNINPTEAAKTAHNIMMESVAPIEMGKADGVVGGRTTRGAITKKRLMTNPANPDSWRTGQKMVQEGLQAYIDENAGLSKRGWSISQMPQDPDMVLIKHISGISPRLIKLSEVREQAAAAEAKQAQEAHDQAVRKAQQGGGITFEHKREWGAPLFERNQPKPTKE